MVDKNEDGRLTEEEVREDSSYVFSLSKLTSFKQLIRSLLIEWPGSHCYTYILLAVQRTGNISFDQLKMIVISKKLTNGAFLSPSEDSEEFCIANIRCFKALLLNLHGCADESCPCKKNCSSRMLLPREDFHTRPFTVVSNSSKPEECLLAFLQSETASDAVGHWLSLLLKMLRQLEDIEEVQHFVWKPSVLFGCLLQRSVPLMGWLSSYLVLLVKLASSACVEDND